MARMKGLAIAVTAAALLTAGPALALDKMKVAIAQKGFWNSAIPWMGQEKGFFKEQGIEMEIHWTDGGADTLQAAITGSFDIGMTNGILGVVGAWGKGAPVVIISGEMLGSPDVFWYVKADSPIKTLKDLNGKTIGFSRPGSSTHLLGGELIKALKLDAKLVGAGGPPATLTQVMSGQLDVGWSAAPISLNLAKEGKIRVIATGNDVPGIATQTVRVNITNKPYLEKNRDTVRRFMVALKKSMDWAYSAPEVGEMYGKFANVDPALITDLRTKYFPIAAMDLKKIGDIEGIVQQAVESKRLDKPLTQDQIRDMLKEVAALNK